MNIHHVRNGGNFLAMVSHVGRILMDFLPQKQVRRSVGICKRGFMDGVMRSERGGEMEREGGKIL